MVQNKINSALGGRDDRLNTRLSLPESLANLASFTRGFMPAAEGETLAHFARVALANGNGIALEIGSYCGLSTIYLGYAATLTNSILICVDHHYGSEENGPGWEHHDSQLVDPLTGNLDTLYRFRRTVAIANLNNTVVAVVADSAIAAKTIVSNLDFIFIDGGHSSKIAWTDYELYAPKLSIGGTLAIHDVFADPKDGGRPPFEIYSAAVNSGHFKELHAEGSLRIMTRLRS